MSTKNPQHADGLCASFAERPLSQPPAGGEAIPTPRINAAIYNGYDYLAKEARKMERDNIALVEALDTLTLVIGLTPIAGNKEALQEAMDLARAVLQRAKEVQS